jgi:hypothetical protein
MGRDPREALAVMPHAYDRDDASPYFEKNERPVMAALPRPKPRRGSRLGSRDHEPRSAFFSGEYGRAPHGKRSP